MRQLLLLSLLFIYGAISAQLITTDPAFPTAGNSVTITFNAAEGSKGLMGHTGDVYAHIGVITDKSTSGSDWKYVKTSWGENTAETKLTRIAEDLYTITLDSTITGYFGVPDGEKILQIALVFRNEDGSATGKTAEGADIYVDVFADELSVSILKPEGNVVVNLNDIIDILVVSNFADELLLFVDGELHTQTSNDSIEASLTALTAGKHWIKAEAKDATTSVFDSIFYYIKEEVTVVDMPEGTIDGVNFINDNSLVLALYAPDKEFVFLQGDFNDWDYTQDLETSITTKGVQQVSTTTTYQMNKTTDGKYFWITLENLEAGKEYGYQFLIDGEINVADPYTDKILDPWNDKYISDETYPGLIQYPEGKATQPVSVFQTAQQSYEWQVTDFTPPEITNMVVYEMLIRDFVATHSYKTIADTLDYLQNMGVNVLELMPINEFEGNSSWGYNPSFYFAPDKYYGPKEELKKLVDECHKRGIAVVIDMVLNHSYGQSPFVRMYYENGKPAANNPWYNVDNNFLNPDAHWGYDFNHESLRTQKLVDSINSYWINEYKVDGFRFDFTKGFGNNIKDDTDPWGSKYDADRVRLLKRMSDEIWKRNSNTYVIFEHLSDNTEETELAEYGILLWGNMTHNYGEGAMGWTENAKSDLAWISYQKRGWSVPHVMGYMESHDEERMLYKNITWGKETDDYSTKDLNTALSRIELAANFFLTIPGPKMIWQFGELGYDYSIDHNGRVGEKPIKWDYYDNANRKKLYDVFGSLAKLKTSQPVFSTTDYTLNVRNATKTIHLNHTDMNVVILGNFDVVEQSINPDFQDSGIWYEYYTNIALDVTDTQAEIVLAPGEYRLYSSKSITGVNQEESKNIVSKNGLRVYPNPVNNQLYIENSEQLVKVAILNIFGQQVYLSDDSMNMSSISVDNLEHGLYIITGTGKNGTVYTSRFIKN